MPPESLPVIAIVAHTESTLEGDFSVVRTTYVDAVVNHGGIPVLAPPAIAVESIPSLLNRIDGLLVPGGVDVDPRHYGQKRDPAVTSVDPELDAFEMELIREAHMRGVPVLAICRGVQSLNVALGGSLVQDLPSEDGTCRHEVRENGRSFLAHTIRLSGDSRLASILGMTNVPVNSLHHQAVDTVAPDLVATGWSDDGVVEALEGMNDAFLIGVQCHPEELWKTSRSPFSRLFASFIQSSAENSRRFKSAISESRVA